MAIELNGAGAVVTGAGSGLGAATVEAFVARGAKVLALDVDAERIATRAGVTAVGVDVADGDAMAAAIDGFADGFDGVPLRVAVACAGIAPAGKLVGRDGPHEPTLFSRTLEVNLVGTFHLLRLAANRMAAAPALADGARGVVVMTASIAAEEGQIAQCAYAASKGGVAAMTLPAARELARHGVRVVAIAPGVFGTPMMAGMPEPVRAGLEATVPFPKRMGAPGEFAQLVVHCVDNAYLNGAVLRLDGGLRMGS
jgi:NAD(P)-dependent dehydrogenase (short-subunit alcohol dehydrogenase family)